VVSSPVLVNGAPAPHDGSLILLRGLAYPSSQVTILKDGVVVATILADAKGDWATQIEVAGGYYGFSIYVVDQFGRRSITSGFSTLVLGGRAVNISSIISAPTVSSNKIVARTLDTITFTGQTYANSKVRVTINSQSAIVGETTSDSLGVWKYVLNTKLLEKGDHTFRAQVIMPNGDISPLSETLGFVINDKIGITATPSVRPSYVCDSKGDFNRDGRVNLIDLSIVLYSWGRTTLPNSCVDLNNDKRVNISDLSILLYWWTG